MKLAALAARIDAGRQLGEQRRVEACGRRTAGKTRGSTQVSVRLQAAVDHLARELRRSGAPQREDRRQAGAGQSLLAVAADVFEKRDRRTRRA